MREGLEKIAPEIYTSSATTIVAYIQSQGLAKEFLN